ncbi:MAG TPA: NCS2 family permease [Candidatus Borkfalkia excrementigallinarum]|uniref:NCS2 family permease n=1 Tax=Candidatus Borkfalkia excrementigallinarum TaxID=2838506 RepID=A0A9D1ZVN0_9FIRM|nr:NCS2 family permease [Candidatus Borkfalkia excrementigallinarum]
MEENQNTEEPKIEETQAQQPAEESLGGEAVAESKYTGFLGKVDNYFGITKMKSSFKTEMLAGLTTFMTMVYILMVNAGMFAELEELYGVTYGAAYIFTALGAIVGTLLMAFLAKIPFAQAPGMGLNAFFVYTICLGMGYTYANALLIVLCSGVLFLILTIVGARKMIVRSVPTAIRMAIPAGIGLFIAFIGLQQAGVVISDASAAVGEDGVPYVISSTIIMLRSFNVFSDAFNGFAAMTAAVAILSLLMIGIFSKLKVKGAVLFGILGSTVLYYIFAGIALATGNEDAAAMFQSISFDNPLQAFADFGTQTFGKAFTEGFKNIGADQIFDFIAALIAFAMVDMFDTIGTLMGTCQAAGKESGLLDETGEVKNIQKALLCDSIATCTGAILGTSTVTTFVESSAGVAEGGRTGLTALVVAVLFAIAMFLSPIASLIPRCATAGALLYVGVLMMGNVTSIDWKDPAAAVPAFLTIAMMSFTYSISYGIAAGFISYTIIKLCTGKIKEISPVTAILTLVFLFTFLFTH